ncbi:MAG: low temperature requirement protein A [Parvularculaceae bacterium]
MTSTAKKLSPLCARDPEEAHRAATQLELFFDLVSVIAIAAIAAGLHHAIAEGHGFEKLPVFIFFFIAAWWAWMNFTWFASAFDNDGPLYRLLVMVIMAGELIFAAGAGHMFETLDVGWGVIGWTVMRAGMASLWFLTAMNPEWRATALRYGFGILVAQGLWILFYFLAPRDLHSFLLFGSFCFLFEFFVPPFAERARATPFHRHHIIERYGLLTIISLGEIMLSISLGFGSLYEGAEHGLPLGAISTALSAFVIGFSLFWIYFVEEDHLPNRNFWTAFIWGYGHLFIFATIAAIGAGVAAELDLVARHSAVSASVLAWWLGAPLALFCFFLWIVRDRYFDLGFRGFALPAIAVVSLAAAAAGASTPMFAVIAVVGVLWRVPMRLAALDGGA